jgi:DNA processing protein
VFSPELQEFRPMADPAHIADIPLFDWLSLERAPRVGPLTMARLLDAFGAPGAALAAGPEEIMRRAGLGEKHARAIAAFSPPKEAILRDMETLDGLGVRVVSRWHSDYPANLKDIYDPPALLFVRGSLRPEDTRAVAVVGTRDPTRYGLEVTEQITRDLVRAGVTTVSGLARGIDTACHKATLKERGRTLGILGCGIDVVYPRENKSLMAEMAESGAVITEFRPGIEPLGTNFYRRNRVVSGLAKGVLVVEASLKSGSLITAGHAVDQNRDVLAIPGSIMNRRSQGPHHLLKQGAGLVESADDVLRALFSLEATPYQPTLPELREDREELSETAREVLQAIDPDPVSIDTLCEALKMNPGSLAGLLLELELSGLIRQYPGKMFGRVLR